MLFNSYIFLLAFMPVALIGYFMIGKKAQTFKPVLAFLLVMSGIFTVWLNVWYLVVLAGSIALNFGFGRLIYEAKDAKDTEDLTVSLKRAKAYLIAGITIDILALLFFKYTNFFIDTINSVFKTDQPMLELLLPLGISFYTFGNIAYLVDIYRGECDGYSLLEFAAYTAFFPKLIQGPITMHSDLLPQLTKKENWKPDVVYLSKGIYRFALGLGKKVLIADVLALIADTGYRNFETIYGFGAVLAILSYSLQIYFDFSGYTDMAIGVSMMMNIELPENFNSPYKSRSISEFWDRWHITLTKFFTKYLYIPMGGSRVALPRVLLNVMIVFLISGLWHGSNWTFVIWGGAHGLFMVGERLHRILVKKIRGEGYVEGNREETFFTLLIRPLKILITFIIVTALWSLFRADSLYQFAVLWRKIYYMNFHFLIEEINPDMITAISGLVEVQILGRLIPERVEMFYQTFVTVAIPFVSLLLCWFTRNTDLRTKTFIPTLKRGIVTVGLLVWCILSLSNVTQFIYSNF